MAKAKSSKAKKSKWKTVALIILLVVIVLLAFVAGTSLGFNQALQGLTGCEEVACDELGIAAEKCEVCQRPGVGVVINYPVLGG